MSDASPVLLTPDVVGGLAGKRVLVVGGGMVGCECVEFLTEREHPVDMIL